MRLFIAFAILCLAPSSAFAFQDAVTESSAAAPEVASEPEPAAESETIAAPVPSTAAVVAVTPKVKDEGFEEETLIGLSEVDHGGYGGPVIRYSRMAGKDVIQVGGKGGWLIDHHLMIGGGGYGVTNQPSPPASIYSPTGRALEMNIGYGGLVLEYLIAPERLFHGTVGVLVGGGGVSINEYNRDHANSEDEEEREPRFQRDDSFFVVEPEIGIEVNIAKFMRINLTGGYRFVTGVGGIGLDNADLRAPSGSLALKFGRF